MTQIARNIENISLIKLRGISLIDELKVGIEIVMFRNVVTITTTKDK